MPYQKAAQVHSAYPAPDGTVWIAEDQARALGKWDPKTQQITEYFDGDFPKHTVRIDKHGTPWISPGTSHKTISRFDVETGKFTHFPGSEEAYGIVLDKDGNCWFVQYVKDGQLGKIDANTGKVTKWTVPTPDSRPRRIDIDPEGNIWFAEFQGGKIGDSIQKRKSSRSGLCQVPNQDRIPMRKTARIRSVPIQDLTASCSTKIKTPGMREFQPIHSAS